MAVQKEGETTPRKRGRGTAKIETKEKGKGTTVTEKKELQKIAEEKKAPKEEAAKAEAPASIAIEKAMVNVAEAVEKKMEPRASNKSRLVALLLCFFLGWAGGHRFYAKKMGTGIAMLFTMGGFGMWYFLDFVLIASGVFKDKNNLPITRWI
jgi:hypothetical protein